MRAYLETFLVLFMFIEPELQYPSKYGVSQQKRYDRRRGK